ncbi:MAG: hypothetical protein K2N38_13625 [Oscillospiraceae bacterium]|nr:hypothetical protein [Oscillospiraceae bacterium]
MVFYDNLARACKENNLKIATIVRECGGAIGSIDGWKKGAIPRSDIVAKLALRLNVSTDFLILGNNSKIKLSNQENELLNYFADLSDEDKGRILGKAEALAELAAERAAKERAAEQHQKTKMIAALADAELEPENDELEQTEEFYIDLCSLPASAGSGVQLDEGFTEPMQIKPTPIAERANYAVRVSGNSMEDTYYDGDIVLVETCPDVAIGEIGIFIVNDQGYIKQRGEDKLISLNPEAPDVPIHEGDVVYCRGRVLGKAEVIE